MSNRRHFLTAAILVFSMTSLSLAESKPAPSDWAQFLGPNRNGISSESDLIDKWPTNGPEELWRVKGGVGMASVAIKGGLAITLSQKDNQFVLALDAKTGAKKWSCSIAPFYKNGMGNGPRATPTIDEDTVYAYSGEGVLAAVSLNDGKLKWSVNLPAKYKSKHAEYGVSCSPLVYGDVVIVAVGARTATIVAVNKKTGDVVWTSGQRDAPGYSSPVIVKVAGKDQLVAMTGVAAVGVNPKDGTELWRYRYITDYNCNTATPVALDGKILISSGENHGSTLLDVSTGQAKPVWESLGRMSTMRNEWQTAIHIDGVVYGFDNVGSAGPVTHLTCIDAKTGKRRWQEPRFGKGNMIYADGKLFATTMKGELVMIKADPNKYIELGRKTVMASTRQAPTLCRGRLYVRDNQDIICFKVSRQ